MSEPSPRLAEAIDMKLATTQAERDKREFLAFEALLQKRIETKNALPIPARHATKVRCTRCIVSI